MGVFLHRNLKIFVNSGEVVSSNSVPFNCSRKVSIVDGTNFGKKKKQFILQKSFHVL